MKGPTPKPNQTRQRRNKHSTNAQLPPPEEARRNEVPDMHERDGGWHPMVVQWWKAVWQSPMAQEYLDADMRGGLYLLADLHQARWNADNPKDLINVAKEIRLQEIRFGLSPIDRRRLQWEVAKAEKVTKRRTPPAPNPSDDPRKALKAI